MILRLAQVRCFQDFAWRQRLQTSTGVTPRLVALPQRWLTEQPARAAAAAAEQRVTPARLVVTHSSYMDGLIPLLDRFVTDPGTATNVSSVIPGRIYVFKGRSELFKMTVRDTTNGFKALARKGTLGQDVFISTTRMDLEDVKAALNRAAGFDLEKGGSRREQKAGRKKRL